MKTKIYYFSGTGNSLYVAQELAKKIKNSVVLPIVSELGKDHVKINAETFGIVFPLHAYTIPSPVRDFLEKGDFHSCKYSFAVCTGGGNGVCRVFDHVKNILRKKKINLSFASYVQMPNNYMLQGMDVSDKKTSRRIIEKADEKIKGISVSINNKEKSLKYKKGFALSLFLFPLIIFLVRKTKYFGMEKRFFADDKCIGCELCEKVCPSGKIKIKKGRPLWRQNRDCYFCFACVNYCPKKAIQVRGGGSEKRGRYHHPAISAKDISKQGKN